MDEDGNPILPLRVGIIVLNSLGHIEWKREAFHAERYIFPIGYKVTRYISFQSFILN